MTTYSNFIISPHASYLPRMFITTHKETIMRKKSITKIVITGGPCAGKTTCMKYLKETLEGRGYGVLIVAESATELITSGCIPMQNIDMHSFQEMILELQIQKEKMYHRIAHGIAAEQVIILLDRGIMDSKAYIDEDSWNKLLETTGNFPSSLCEERYHAVIHLRSAALGAEEFYSCENNSARRETLEEARICDIKTLDAWTSHPQHHVIENIPHTSFEHKTRRTLEVVLGIINSAL